MPGLKNMENQTYTGSCHCGAVKFTVDTTLEKVLTCDCSMCNRAGTILTFVPESQFTLQCGEESLSHYQFNKKRIDHLFCKICGIKPFGRGKDAEGNSTIAINVRCLDGVDVQALTPQHYNGKDL